MDPELPTKIIMYSLLSNEYKPPLSSIEFYQYTKEIKCDELVDYWKSVQGYYKKTKTIDLKKQTDVNSILTKTQEKSHQTLANQEFKESSKERSNQKYSLMKKLGSLMNGSRGRSTSEPARRKREEVEVEIPTSVLESMSLASVPIVDEQHNQIIDEILNLYVKSGAKREINIPSIINKKLQNDYANGVRGIALFKPSIDHVEFVLQTSCLPGFLKQASSKTKL